MSDLTGEFPPLPSWEETIGARPRSPEERLAALEADLTAMREQVARVLPDLPEDSDARRVGEAITGHDPSTTGGAATAA